MTKGEGQVSHDKPCTLCGTPRPVLVRCQIDETGKWHFLCPGKCWTSVSGGEIDAKGHEAEHPFYRYGGMWKNRHEDGPANAKKPKKNKKRGQGQRKTSDQTSAPDDDATKAGIDGTGEEDDGLSSDGPEEDAPFAPKLKHTADA